MRKLVWALPIVALLALAAFLLLRGSRPEPASSAAAEPATPAPAAGTATPAAAVEAPQPTAERDLGAVLALSPDCGIGEPLAAIFGSMVAIDPATSVSSAGAPITLPGFPAPLTPRVRRTVEKIPQGEERHIVADLDLPGRWHGLAVTGLRLDFYEMSDVAARQIRFADPPERVRETLARQGFDLPPVGEYAEIEGEGMMPSIGVDRIEGEAGSALACTTG